MYILYWRATRRMRYTRRRERIMRSFGKKTNGTVKKMLILRLLFILLSGALLLFFTFYSYAWFAKSSSVHSTGMSVVVSAETYDILIDRTTTYDTGHDYISGENELKDHLAANGYSLSATSTATASDIAFELVNEYSFENHRYIMPGSYGTLSFYIRPRIAGSGITARFSLNLGGYKYDLEQNEMVAITSTSVLNMLKGHILFFGERTGADHEHYVYDDLIDDGEFSFDSLGKSLCNEIGKTDCYKVTLYWEWPITYDAISDNIRSSDPYDTKKYPEELGDYLTDHEEYFFAVSLTSDKQEEKIDAYNDGDQTIGDGAVCLVVQMKAL